MTSEQKAVDWQQHIAGWRESGLSQKTYCQQQGLSIASFGYWRTRLHRKPVDSGKFIPVKLSGATSSVTVLLPAGLRIDCPVHALAEVLPVLYRSVQDLP
jgi:hypothetical protein